MNKMINTKLIAEGGVMIGLATLLSLIKVYEAPFGGSVTAGSMIPIMIFAARWGMLQGILVGSIYGVLQFILKPYFYHPVQFLLDYPIAFGLLGLAGIINIKKKNKVNHLTLGIGILLAILGRFIAHLLSGVVFFYEYAGDMNPWLYSTLYNGSYLGIELIVSLIIILLIWKPVTKIPKPIKSSTN
ncbi:energy-coupled thiamine transporter ThiT [Thermohalobacter berrensis]|uniref:Energy-coupled thiamine transporter ThiT n=1 Tax=Thermohalobacter berrensis TaxID=99594 RepID=A0A419T9W5_9FIRM|nr:energy-coupled thiamine transporter ThiT [Thermohalobacter berrensis]RKD34255.1 energy-coupled thiamine transporter ThiT [Thermohalobacter berrensis]